MDIAYTACDNIMCGARKSEGGDRQDAYSVNRMKKQLLWAYDTIKII